MRKGRALFLSLALLLGNGTLAETLSDPTRPDSGDAGKPETPASALQISLIRLGPKPLAVINGTSVKVGERIEGYRLLALHPNHATLSGTSGQLILPLVQSQTTVSRSQSPVTSR